MVGLLFGYAAGIAAGVFLRPAISISSMVVAVVPASAVALTTPDTTYIGVGALLVLFLAVLRCSLPRNGSLAPSFRTWS